MFIYTGTRPLSRNLGGSGAVSSGGEFFLPASAGGSGAGLDGVRLQEENCHGLSTRSRVDRGEGERSQPGGSAVSVRPSFQRVSERTFLMSN